MSLSAYAEEVDIKVIASILANCQIIQTNDINFGVLDPVQATEQQAKEFSSSQKIELSATIFG